jgi:hypothetical protein
MRSSKRALERARHILRGDEAVRIQGLNGTASTDRSFEYDRETHPRETLTELAAANARIARNIKTLRKTASSAGGS